MRQGRKKERRPVDRFDVMSEGELVAEALVMLCVNGDDGFGYPFMDPERYGSWRDWVMERSEDELRDWVRANASK